MKILNTLYEFVAKLVFFYEPREDVYDKKVPTKTEVAGYKIDDDLLGRVLTEKYKAKNLQK